MLRIYENGPFLQSIIQGHEFLMKSKRLSFEKETMKLNNMFLKLFSSFFKVVILIKPAW